MIIDYSTARPTIAELKALHITAVGRYIGWDSVQGYPSIGKNISTDEAKTLLGAGIDIFLAFEYAADAATKGAPQGKADGELATKQLAELGAPAGMTVYFAMDFDVQDYAPNSSDPKAKLGPCADYFEAINAIKPDYTVGVYGGYYAVSRVFDAHLALMGWQTLAWSGGQWDPRAEIRQEIKQVLGGDVDLLSSPNVDFGQWPRPLEHAPHGWLIADGARTLDQMTRNRTAQSVHRTAWHTPAGFGPMEEAHVNAVLGPSVPPRGSRWRA